MKKVAIALVIIIILGGIFFYFKGNGIQSLFFQPRSTSSRSISSSPESQPETKVIAENLDVPWEIEFLPSGDLLVTERSGNLVRLKSDSRETIPVQGVEHIGEGGLMGLALHPKFAENKFIYLYLTTKASNGLTNRVERYVYDEAANQLSDRQVILENIPGAFVHDGGRIAFGPDSKLYITTGDAGTEENAQDTNSLAGKILRLNEDGSIPSDNPFQNATYSYGHRNPQGLAWDDQGRLWSTEHGPSGTNTGYDEVNVIEKGANYGWPTIQGDETREGMKTPIIQSGSEDTWAPGGMTIIGNTLYFVGLRGQALYSLDLSSNQLTESFKETYGRLRVVKEGPDGYLYIATSNTDGRGEVKAGDDKIIRIFLTLSDSKYEVTHPANFTVSQENGNNKLYFHGPTQSKGTEVYDGVILYFALENTSLTLEEYVTQQFPEQKTSIEVAGYSGFKFREEGFGSSDHYLFKKDDSSTVLHITALVADPNNNGYQMTVDQIMSSLVLK